MGKKAANCFGDHYEQISKVTIPPNRKKEVREELKQTGPHVATKEYMNKPFNMKELEDALRILKKRKSPGPDNITNEMLQHLGMKAKKILLDIFNKSWQAGTVPQCWREAIMVPIHKKGKDRRKVDSYRPISLTSCVGKLMERLVNTRLIWHLESNNLLSSEQAGFRQHRSTEDQVTYLAQEIDDGFQAKKHTLAVWIDMEKAFDKVWKDGLRLKLRQSGVKGYMYRWISQYLTTGKLEFMQMAFTAGKYFGRMSTTGRGV